MSQTVLKKAVHKIVLKDREIAPGTHFPCPQSELKFLTEAGAITDPKRTTAAEAQAAVAEPEPAAVLADKPLAEMDEDELHAKAVSLGVGIRKGTKPDTIRKKLAKAMAAQGGDDEDGDGDDDSGADEGNSDLM